MLRLDTFRGKENLSRLIKRPLCNLWNAILSWNYEENFLDSFPTRECPLYAATMYFRGNGKRREREHGAATSRQEEDPLERPRAHIGPFRRNAERAAIYPATKIKHRIVPISPFPWYFTYLRWDTGWDPVEYSRALLRFYAFTWKYHSAANEKERDRASERLSTKASRKIYQRYRLLSLLNPGCALLNPRKCRLLWHRIASWAIKIKFAPI